MSNAQTPTQSPWKDEFNRRIKAFAESTSVEESNVISALKELGVDGDEPDCIMLMDSEEFLPASDVFKTFVDSKLAKIAKVRLGLSHLRGKTTLDEANPTLNGNSNIAQAITKIAEQNRRVEDLSPRELLERYGDATPEIAERLNRITHGRPCIILNADGNVNIEESLKLVKTAQKQPTSDRGIVNGHIVRVYRAGTEFPVKPLDECPFYPNIPLVNGVCGKSGTDWNGITQECRILVRIYVCEIETTQLSKMSLKQICKDAKEGASHFRDKYSEAALRYDDLNGLGQLPSLKISHSNIKQEKYSGIIDKAF